MAFYDKIVALAKGEVGYHEGRSGGYWNNDQKYSKDVPGFGWSNRQAWCATFNTWLDWKLGLTNGAGDTSKSPCTASVRVAYDWGRKKGRFTEYPVIGAWVIFRVSEHTERCVAFDDTYVWTVGGNTVQTYSPQGDGVYFKKYLRRDAKITGYVVPVFPDGNYKSPDPKWNVTAPVKEVDMSKPIVPAVKTPAKAPAKKVARWSQVPKAIKSGQTSEAVKAIQDSLNILGVPGKMKVKKLAVTGKWDLATKKAYAYYQRSLGYKGSDADGVPGKESFTKLITASKKYTLAA